MTSAGTKLLGVVGWPVAHSRSPAIHTAALAACGIDAVYLAFAVPPERLEEAIGGLAAIGALGASVTVPHKERALALCDALDPAARAIGAVNTLVWEDERLVGANTDADGLVRSIEARGVRVRDARALVIGSGGAARASAHGLSVAGARVRVAARRPERAEAIARELGLAGAVDLRDASAMKDASGETDLLVQATSAPMGAEAEAFARGLPLVSLPDGAAVVDLVYAPRETAVLRAAAARGLRAIDGLGMLVWQAALAFERWHGVEAPIEVMTRAAGA